MQLQWMYKETKIDSFATNNFDLISDSFQLHIKKDSKEHEFLKIYKFLSAEGMQKILQHRVRIEYNTRYMEDPFLLKDLSYLLKHGHLASLCDCFWLKEENETITWKEVSLYKKTNPNDYEFKERIFSEKKLNNPATLTLRGHLYKWWTYENSQWVLYKQDSAHLKEAICEVDTWKLMQNSSFNYLAYWHPNNDITTSACTNFTDENNSFIPMDWLSNDEQNITKQIEEVLGLEQWGVICILDIILQNYDRNTYNFGLIYNDQTKRFENCVIFDNGLDLKVGLRCLRRFRSNDQNNSLVSTNPTSWKTDESNLKQTYEDFLNQTNKFDVTNKQNLKQYLTPSLLNKLIQWTIHLKPEEITSENWVILNNNLHFFYRYVQENCNDWLKSTRKNEYDQLKKLTYIP